MWDSLLDIVFPRSCFGCGKWGSYICKSCATNKISYFNFQVCPVCERASQSGLTHSTCKSDLDGLFVLANYKDLIIKVVREIKYQGVFAASSEVGSLIRQHYHKEFEFDYFVPVPLSKKRERLRGFNQAEKLAKALKLKPVKNLLVRTKETKPQFDLKFEQRKDNVKGVFAINPNLLTRNLQNLSLCLVDDVATTGSTLFECAKTLKMAGAKRVYGVTIARGG